MDVDVPSPGRINKLLCVRHRRLSKQRTQGVDWGNLARFQQEAGVKTCRPGPSSAPGAPGCSARSVQPPAPRDALWGSLSVRRPPRDLWEVSGLPVNPDNGSTREGHLLPTVPLPWTIKRARPRDSVQARDVAPRRVVGLVDPISIVVGAVGEEHTVTGEG